MGRLFASLAFLASVSAVCDGAPPQCPVANAAWAWASVPTPAARDVQAKAVWAWESVSLDTKAVKPAVPVTAKGWHFPKAGELSAPGDHWHVCACGRVISHGDEHQGDLAAHTCVCGRLNTTKVPGIPINDVANCPNGRCPK